jgi:rfaE bifunctional protein kinase chain/domain
MMIEEKRLREILAKFKKIPQVLVLGDIGIDKYTYGDVKRISPEAPVPVVEVSREWSKLGLAANVSDNLLSMGVNSTICGVIGEDKNADLVEDLLENNGLSTWGLIRINDRKTTFKERVVTRAQQICRVDYESKEPIPESTFDSIIDRVKEFSNNHSALIIEDYGKGVINEKLVQDSMAMFKEQGKLVSVDPSRWTPAQYYKGVDLLKPNLTEAVVLVQSLGYRNESDLGRIASILLDKLNLNKLVITLGSEGMALFEKDYAEVKVIPTYSREVFDVSGAGDTAISSICLALSSGASLEESAWIGNLAGGVVVGKKGTATVTTEEIIHQYHRIQEFSS